MFQVKRTLVLFCVILSIVKIYSQDGSLDLSFDVDGKLTTIIGTDYYDYGRSVAIQQDGKIIVVGESRNSSYNDFAVVRYNTDGSLDNSFSSDGIIITQIGSANDYATSVAIQENGKIVVAGYSYNGVDNDFALIRYNTDGSIDSTFGSDGIVITQIGSGDDRAFSVAIQHNGKMVVTGYSYNGSNTDFALARYKPDGSLDLTFDSDGIVTTTIIGNSNDYGRSLAIHQDGKIVVAGYIHNGSNYDIAVVRYDTTGSLDLNFNSDGIVSTPIGAGNDMAFSVAIQQDGKIVVAGKTNNGSNDDFALVRYDSLGILDLTFDNDGIVTTPIGTKSDVAYSLAIQRDGKIVVAGSSNTGTNDDFAIVKYNTDGSLDNSFSSDGKVTAPIGVSTDNGQSIAIQKDGKLVVAGFSLVGSSYYNFSVTRFNNTIIEQLRLNIKVFLQGAYR